MANKKPLVFYSSPPSLKNISSIRTAINTWGHKITNSSFECMFHDTWKEFSFDNTLPIPETLVDSINLHIDVVLKEIKAWVNFYAFRIFCEEEVAFDVLKNNFRKIIWNLDGTVDDVRTAKNMITWPALSDFYKLKIACAFCFIDDLKKLRPGLSINIKMCNANYEDDPLMFYWENSYSPPRTGDEPVRRLQVLEHYKVDRWSAIEYFYDINMNPVRYDWKKRLTSFIILKDNSFFIKKLLVKLNEDQLNYVISNHGYDVMVCILLCPFSRQIASQTWDYFKDKIDQIQFFKIILWILNYEKSHSQRLDESLIQLCFGIWSKAPDELKQHVCERLQQSPKLYEYRIENLKMLPRNMKFFIRILSDASYSIRNQIWVNHWTKLIRATHPIHLQNLLEMCLNDDNKIDEFKEKQMMEFELIKEYCCDLIQQECYNEMYTYLTFCSRNKEKLFQVRKQAIKLYFKENYILWDEKVAIVGNVFVENNSCNVVDEFRISNGFISLFDYLTKIFRSLKSPKMT